MFIIPDMLERKSFEPLLKKKEELLRTYMALILETNSQVRLVGPSEEKILWENHILDCVHTLPLLPSEGKVADLGSGAGLPGMIWAICRPDLEVVLCESIRKKAAFLEKVRSLLDLSSCRVAAERSEELARRERESFALVGARAVSHLGVVGEYAAPLVMRGGTFLAMKGEKGEEEAREIGSGWKELGFSKLRRYSYCLDENTCHYVITLRKEECTPEKYPRRSGMAEKRRWW